MKFGKRMRSLASKDWEHDYVDYKQLKKQIRQLQDELPPQQANEAELVDAQTTFHDVLLREMVKINAAHARIQEHIEFFELMVLRSAVGNRWVLSPAKARSFLLDVIEISQKVDAFRRFVVLNSLAIVKITKKFDKAMGTSLKATVLEDLKQQSFYDGECLDRISAETIALTDRIMLCVLPDGNFRIDKCSVSCPICLSTEVKTSITLACAHTFCWSCLSKAAEHRFNSCPLCRRAQSIDPRYYEIDGLMKRFKRAYSFVEEGLDRAPLASSPMRQILAEAFELVNSYLADIETQYASITPPASVCDDADSCTTEDNNQENNETQKPAVENDGEEQERASATIVALERGAPVEILYGGLWYPGMIMQCNADATYSVLWWVKDNSQRFGQRVAPEQLREPRFEDSDARSSYVLYDFAAGAWRTATEWAMEPFRRLRTLSQSDRSSSSHSV
uniref:RING-type domain-containing protein n=1 Tax=Globisporangium ultimum (strain ATCC 200006 / CBS 805.95 / DAOM BR144) TaxID=431595 RepID=K3WDF7_GLOUD